jgi:thiamine biosynthesis lipoprotein
MRRRAVAALMLTMGTFSVATSSETLEVVTRRAYLMGTRAQLVTYAMRREAGLAALELALQVLKTTERELSTWSNDSDMAVLNRHPIGEPWHANPHVCRMLSEVFDWRATTAGAFDPAIGRLLAAWDIHGEGRMPSQTALAAARFSSGLGLLSLDRTRCTVTRRADVTIDVGAFGKGEALDRVEAALGNGPWMIDLGGQVSVGGPLPGHDAWTVDIAHPLQRNRSHVQVRMREGSLSTSGGSERDLIVNGLRVAHLLDPRTGRPAPFSGSVTVWHRRGLIADALSTALFVMGPAEGLPWAEARGLAVCYLIPERDSVRVVMTSAFRPFTAPQS